MKQIRFLNNKKKKWKNNMITVILYTETNYYDNIYHFLGAPPLICQLNLPADHLLLYGDNALPSSQYTSSYI